MKWVNGKLIPLTEEEMAESQRIAREEAKKQNPPAPTLEDRVSDLEYLITGEVTAHAQS